MKTSTCLPLLCLATLPGLSTAMADEPRGFDASVAPILARRCLDCHSGRRRRRGSSTCPRGLGRCSAAKGASRSSPASRTRARSGSGSSRTRCRRSRRSRPLEKAALRDWIAAGADLGDRPDRPLSGDHLPPGRPRLVVAPAGPPPRGPRGRRGRTGPDRRSTASSSRSSNPRGSRPRPEADRRTLIRRLRFDLTGLPPTPEEVDAFLADNSPDAYETLVDRLLASPDFGVRWARWWLDLARFGESNGFEHDEARPNAWRYRDWVVDALNRDLPYDEFARLQIAGDALRPDDPGADRGDRLPRRRRVRLGRPDPAERAGEGHRPGRRAGGHHRHRRPDLPRPDRQLRPLPRPQVRPDPPGRILPLRLRPRRHPRRRSRAARRPGSGQAYAVNPAEAGVMRVHLRGNPGTPGDVVSAGGIAAVVGPSADFGLPPDAPQAERRKRLAAWITSTDNPLFARVAGQPALAGPLRLGPGRDAQRPRLQRRPPVASRVARLAGLRAGRRRAGA